MAAACPVLAADAPLVRGLTSVVDCNVQSLVRSGYGALFQSGAPLAQVLTLLLTVYVAFIGFGLMLGRTQLRVGDVVLTTVKLAFVLGLATQWQTYEALVYRFLFDGPQQLASAVTGAMLGNQSLGLPPLTPAADTPTGDLAVTVPQPTVVTTTDVLDGLQRAFDQLQASALLYSRGAVVSTVGSVSPLMGGVASGAFLLTASAGGLLVSTLGVLLVAKVVLGMLLALGPLFIALLLFDTTRGLFEGWLRATLGAALTPLVILLLLAFGLTLLQPLLIQLAELRLKQLTPLAPVYSVALLTLVIGGVAAGLTFAGAAIARGFKLPSLQRLAPAGEVPASERLPADEGAWTQPRAARIAAAAAAMDRRVSLDRTGRAVEPASAASTVETLTGADRRTALVVRDGGRSDRGAAAGGAADSGAQVRLGQTGGRRSVGPRGDRISRRTRT